MTCLSSAEAKVRAELAQASPLEVFQRLIQENNDQIRSPELGNGRALAAARTAIYTELVGQWAAEQQKLFGYDKPFGVVALGGTGRGEMAPYSDNDFGFLFDDAIEGNPFLLELQQQVLHTSAFERRCGFVCQALPFSLDDLPNLTGKQLNTFLDMRPVYDPRGLAGLFRDRIRSTYDPFEHFLHVRGFWKGQWEKAAGESERLDRFDIKNDGLRVFLAGIWTLAGKGFLHSHQIYEAQVDPADLEAYEFLLRIRGFIHSRRKGTQRPNAGGNHAEDVLSFEDFTSFGELLGPEADEHGRFEFANAVRARLISARRRVACFTKGVIESELKVGRRVSPDVPIVYGVCGLSRAVLPVGAGGREKSRAALGLLLASQRYGVGIDPSELQTTFYQAGDWLEPVPELTALFYEQRGSLADAFEFLSQLDGAEEHLFPGHAQFEASLDGRVMAERQTTRGVMERQKLRTLEEYLREGRARLGEFDSRKQQAGLSPGVAIEIETALLDTEHLAAVKLALKTKRLPLTPHDLMVRQDLSRPLHERFSTGISGIPLADYYQPFWAQADFPRETIRMAEFLVANRRVFKERAEAGLNDARQVSEFARLCQNEQQLRSLFVFTCVDRAEWESEKTDPTRWFNTRELYAKAMMRFKPAADPIHSLKAAGFTIDEQAILKDFGEDFFGGVYRQYASRFGAHLVGLVQDGQTTTPKVCVLRDGASTIVGVAARDFRGLAACISGALWHQGVELRQAHLFSAMNYGLALDFFHVAPRDKPLPAGLTRFVEGAIQAQLYIGPQDEALLPRATGTAALREWRPRQFCLRFETHNDVGGLIYALTYKVFRHLRGNIFGLVAHTGRSAAYLSIYHTLPADLPPGQAQSLLREHFQT